MKKTDVIKDILEILSTQCEIPSEELIKQGTALIGIGQALEGQSNSDAIAIIKSVESIMNIEST